jgi:hypothetical protein
VTRDPNIDITELGIYEQAISIWESKKLELEELEKYRLEQHRLMEEEQQRQILLQQYQSASQETSQEISQILGDAENTLQDP